MWMLVRRRIGGTTAVWSCFLTEMREKPTTQSLVAQSITLQPQKVTKNGKKSEVHEEQLLAGSHQACKIISIERVDFTMALIVKEIHKSYKETQKYRDTLSY